jgi:radical SAM superfamily enzyme YgiQ (UPF0313 family)
MLDKVNTALVPLEQNTSKKIKILFYHAGTGEDIWLYTASLQLKTHIDLFNPELAAQLEWLVPLQVRVSDDELIDHINQTETDILCTGHFVWNHAFLLDQLASVKEKLPNHVKVISGGPSIDVNIDPEFFEHYPYIDYAVYGAGEVAFSDILSHLVLKKPLISLTTSNCGWKHNETGKTVVAGYKFVKMIETSPFLHNKKLFFAMVKNAAKLKKKLWLAYTVTRGCPYSCTFCDWNSGFDTKVSRRKHTYKEEIDLFQKLKIKEIMWSDANFGQYSEDLDIAEYFAYKNTHENANFTIISGNFSKLKKENNLKIFHVVIKSRLVKTQLQLSIQDTNEEVLKNINRPDVGWEVHSAMIDELYQAYPHITCLAHLIYGLPGQNVETWRQTLAQVTGKNVVPQIYINQPLPASPALRDPEYQKKFQFEYVLSTTAGIGSNSNYTFPVYLPKKSISFDEQQLVEMTTLGSLYSGLSMIKTFCWKTFDTVLDIDTIVDVALNQDWYKNLNNNLYHNWTTEQNFFYNIGDAKFTDPKAFGFFMTTNNIFSTHLYNMLPEDLQNKFLQPEVQAKYHEYATGVIN